MGAEDEAGDAGLELATSDGRRLHAERRGQGSPVVVFEAGMGASRTSWGAVVPAVAERTATVAYDRSGLGRSAPDPAPRGLPRLADDLVDVLGQLGDGPFVLVAHSWGGPVVRLAAARLPGRLAGLVLVDATDELCDMYFDDRSERQERAYARMAPWLARLGLAKLIVRRLAARLPEPAAQAMRREDGTLAAMRTHAAEVVASTADLRRLRDAPPAVPDVPLVVISGTRRSRLEGTRRDALVAAHRARAEAAPQGRHVTTDRAAHMVPLDDPEVIVREVLRVVEAARAG